MGILQDMKEKLHRQATSLEEEHGLPHLSLYPMILFYMRFYDLSQDEAIKSIRSDAQKLIISTHEVIIE